MTSSSKHQLLLDRAVQLFMRYEIVPRISLQHYVCGGCYEATKNFMKTLRPYTEVPPISLAKKNVAYRLTAKGAKQYGITQKRKCPNGDYAAELIGLCCYCCLPREGKGEVENRTLLTTAELRDAFPELYSESIQKARYVLSYAKDGRPIDIGLVLVDTDRAQPRTIVKNAQKEVRKRLDATDSSVRKAFHDLILRDQRFNIEVVTKTPEKAESIMNEYREVEQTYPAWKHVQFKVIAEETFGTLCPPQIR